MAEKLKYGGTKASMREPKSRFYVESRIPNTNGSETIVAWTPIGKLVFVIESDGTHLHTSSIPEFACVSHNERRVRQMIEDGRLRTVTVPYGGRQQTRIVLTETAERYHRKFIYAI